MAKILVLGKPGSGKTFALRNLDQASTFIINVDNKPFTFRGWKRVEKKSSEETVNYFASRDYNRILSAIKRIDRDMPHIKTIVIDDFQYMMCSEFLNRSTEIGYSKFSEIAQHTVSIIDFASYVRPDLNIIFLAHSVTSDDGFTKMKTIGKLMDEKISLDGKFVLVFLSVVNDGEYVFTTQNNGDSVARTPHEMFDNFYITNDLKLITDKVNSFYSEDLQQ